MKFWVSKAKVWGCGGEASIRRRQKRGVVGDFCSFLIKIPHFEAYLNLFLCLYRLILQDIL